MSVGILICSAGISKSQTVADVKDSAKTEPVVTTIIKAGAKPSYPKKGEIVLVVDENKAYYRNSDKKAVEGKIPDGFTGVGKPR